MGMRQNDAVIGEIKSSTNLISEKNHTIDSHARTYKISNLWIQTKKILLFFPYTSSQASIKNRLSYF